jgi:transketolase
VSVNRRPRIGRVGSIDRLCINTIRTLSIDAIQKANSGHPGTPMALAPVAYTLWQDFLRFDPAEPIWPNRDRFVLSAGHASMLLYSLLFLTGVRAVDPDYEVIGDPAVSLDDIKRFRQLDSRAPGHPEYRWTSGVETTTGPLGQGIATTVGMAIASKWLGARYNRPGAELFDFDVYAIAGDGCLMEGVSHEAASVAGHLRLDNLCWIYDNNHITIDGRTSLTYDDDVASRFLGYGWNVTRVGDANDTELVARALGEFRAEPDRPTLVVVDSHIGYGSPHKQDTPEAHGEPLGEEEVRETKRAYGWPEDAQFLVPDGVLEHFADGIGKRGAEQRAAWEEKLAAYAEDSPELAAEIEAMQRRELPGGWDADIPSFEADEEKGIATRKASNKVENAIAGRLPWLLAGSADLTDSTSVRLSFDESAEAEAGTQGEAADFEPGSFGGRQLHYGVREHESAAISNGLSLSKLRPLWSTYLTFSDYARPAIRLSALMELPVIHLFTHDSIGLGEDGPTHQPVEQLASLRAVPGLDVIRPADANEVAEAWRVAIDRSRQPVALVLTRQDVPVLDRGRYASAEGLRRGGYVLADGGGGAGGSGGEGGRDGNSGNGGDPDVILIATGSEVAIAVAAHEELVGEGIRSRVVSLPCWELFDRQDEAYRDGVLPEAVAARVSIEEASTIGWDRYVGPAGERIGMHTFGSSAPLKDVQTKFGFTPDRVAETAREVIERVKEKT